MSVLYAGSIERHERLGGSRAPVVVREVTVLKALLVGLFALVLVTQAAAAAMQHESVKAPRKTKHGRTTQTLDERLELKLAVARKYRGTVAFFKSHRLLLSSDEHRDDASAALMSAQRRLVEVSRTIRVLRSAVEKREARRRASASPKAAICNVFGPYCRQAVAVAWCESHLATTAQNGEYLGLFQMGSYERRLFGHGSTARAQAEAAHAYFVRSGRDWSPWSCKPGYAM